MLADLGPDEINRRFAAADRYLRDSGVFYRVYEDPAGVGRPWPFSHVPLLIEPSEWKQLRAGLIQRAELLEAILADVYGPANLVRDGRLPAALVAGNPEFLRPLVGVDAAGRGALRSMRSMSGVARRPLVGARRPHAGAVGRGLRDREPSRASRAFPTSIAPCVWNALRRSSRRFRPSFPRSTARTIRRVCLLTPGPLNETYFEHAYLARYLGLLLVEGEDLTVRDDGVFIRTVSGLRRAEVLLRRLDADFSDPLELNAGSRLGVPGLVQAVRDGKVVVVNALGAGLVESRALMAFLPALAPAVLGTDLAMPNIATWWLGRAALREEMIE